MCGRFLLLENAAFCKAISKPSPFQTEVAKVIMALMLNAEVAIIAPFTESYVRDSTVPVFAMFRACSYVKCLSGRGFCFFWIRYACNLPPSDFFSHSFCSRIILA